MPLDYARTVALVTGGNRGLGRAFVDELLHRGATVDVAVLAERVPGLNLLINKAGIHKPTNVLNPGAARITAEVLAVNTIGIVAVTAALQRLLVQSRGAVLNLLSAGSWLSGNSPIAPPRPRRCPSPTTPAPSSTPSGSRSRPCTPGSSTPT